MGRSTCDIWLPKFWKELKFAFSLIFHVELFCAAPILSWTPHEKKNVIAFNLDFMENKVTFGYICVRTCTLKKQRFLKRKVQRGNCTTLPYDTRMDFV